MRYLFLGIACAAATLFFALGVGGSLKASVTAGCLSSIGYVIYLLMKLECSESASVFVATLVVCLLAETLARILKTPSTVLSIPAILPLVPGLMLYRTMLDFGKGDTLRGMSSAVETLIVAGTMSLAVTLATIIAKLLFRHKK